MSMSNIGTFILDRKRKPGSDYLDRLGNFQSKRIGFLIVEDLRKSAFTCRRLSMAENMLELTE
jgi:hypothetical protein